jgi:hypothetical protein
MKSFRNYAWMGLALGVASGAVFSNAPVLSPVAPDWGGPPDRHRSRGKQAKPKKRSNRLTISKRVRRKHRRAKCS